MRTKFGKPILHAALLATGVVMLLAVGWAAASGNVDPARRFAWSAATGWINFSPAHGGVAVYDDHLEGYAWAENTGWIHLGTYTGGGSYTYANSSNSDYGVNVSTGGALSGYAWSTTAGWINFAPTYGGVSIDPDDGSFSGYAWSENTGWIHFKPDTYNVVATGGSVNASDKYAWSTAAGWINFSPAHGGVAVYDDHLESYAWAENAGWIRLGTHTGGGPHTYANSSNSDYGVNVDASWALSGYAWSTTAGWVNFAPTYGGVSIDPDDGSFSGYAWSENTGWIHFKPDTYNVAVLLAELSLTKVISPEMAAPGQVVTYTLAFSNTGSNPALGVVISDDVPVSLTVQAVITHSDVGLVQSGTGNRYAWRADNLPAGQGGAITITGQISPLLPSGAFTNTASMAAAQAAVEATASLMVVREVYASQQSGPWSSGATWGSATTPTAMDSVTVTAGTTVTVDSDAQCYRLFVEPGGVLVIPAGVMLSIEGELVNNGTLRQVVGSVPAGSPTTFLHIQDLTGTQYRHWGVVITSTGGSMGTITVTIRGNQDCGGGGSPVQRCFVIEPANPTTATLQFYYRSVETNTNSSPLVWRWDGTTWQLVANPVDTEWGGSGDALWVRVTNGPAYSPFVLAESDLVPTAVALRALAARPAGPAAWLVVSIVMLGAAVVVLKRKR